MKGRKWRDACHGRKGDKGTKDKGQDPLCLKILGEVG